MRYAFFDADKRKATKNEQDNGFRSNNREQFTERLAHAQYGAFKLLRRRSCRDRGRTRGKELEREREGWRMLAECHDHS